MTNDISRKALDQIQMEDIRPDAEWKFILKRSLVWVALGFTAALGALSLSMTLLPFLTIDRNILSFGLKHLLSPAVLRLFPLPWIVFFAVFIAIAVIEFRNTRHGYRHRAVMVTSGLILFVVIGAGIFHIFRMNERSDREFRRRIPPYANMNHAPADFWSQENEGFIAGTILSVGQDSFMLRDLGTGTWNVRIGEETVILPGAAIESGGRVKIVGERNYQNIFDADEILPVRPTDFGGPCPNDFDECQAPPQHIARERLLQQ